MLQRGQERLLRLQISPSVCAQLSWLTSAIAILVFLTVALVLGPGSNKWRELAPTAHDSHGPHVRYGANMVYDNLTSSLWITHGYAYESAVSNPYYQSNTWRFDISSASWSALTPHHHSHNPPDATTAAPPVPEARMAATLTLLPDQDAWVFYGGEDGGSRQAIRAYDARALFDDVWLFRINRNAPGGPSAAWERLANVGNGPKVRHHAAAGVASTLYIFGGLMYPDGSQDQVPSSRLYAFSLLDKSWTLVECSDATAPAPRYGHSMVSFGHNALAVFGGRTAGDGLDNSVYIFDIDACLWRTLPPAMDGTGDRPTPAPRQYHSAVVRNNAEMIVFGGADCTGGSCTCMGDLWSLNLDTGSWTLVETGSADNLADSPKQRRRRRAHEPERYPIARYQHSMAASPSAVYVFGGESFRPYAYYADVWQFAFSLAPNESPSLLSHPYLVILFLVASIIYLVHALALRLVTTAVSRSL